MCDFPVEIWSNIISHLSPQHPSAYRLGPGCSNALSGLCRINSTFRLFAESILYSTPYITPRNLEAFTGTVIEQGVDTNPLEFVPTVKGHLVKRLAIAEFEKLLTDEEINSIGTIFFGLRAVITHLFFDVNLPYRDWIQPICDNDFASIRWAMQSLLNLEEFCTFERFTVWPSLRWVPAWPRLKRLAFAKSTTDGSIGETIAWIPASETCIVFPDLQRPLFASADLVNHHLTSETPKRVMVFLPKNQAEDYTSMRNLWEVTPSHLNGDAMLKAMNEYLKVVELPDRPSAAPGVAREETMHFRSAVIDGQIWDAEGTTWGAYTSSMRR
ncbi:hypothetical protein FRB94_010950 [Tulasnella sp. JGI-2019a]|nr:hypothetical protein FRB94_010950 [Tulasnella sp. JGI-2019a]